MNNPYTPAVRRALVDELAESVAALKADPDANIDRALFNMTHNLPGLNGTQRAQVSARLYALVDRGMTSREAAQAALNGALGELPPAPGTQRPSQRRPYGEQLLDRAVGGYNYDRPAPAVAVAGQDEGLPYGEALLKTGGYAPSRRQSGQGGTRRFRDLAPEDQAIVTGYLTSIGYGGKKPTRQDVAKAFSAQAIVAGHMTSTGRSGQAPTKQDVAEALGALAPSRGE